MRVRQGLPSFRKDELVLSAVKGAIAGGHKPAFRVVHFSIQSNHLHLLIEAHDTQALSLGMRGSRSEWPGR
jgi:putative transposase